MSRKLLIITAGTVAAGVGQIILRQRQAHPHSALNIMMRYIDTAYLPNRYPAIRDQEWFQMNIDPVHMQALYNNIATYPNLNRMLFPGLLPATHAQGGGGIRYNGAGAVEVNREALREWLKDSMTSLARSGDASTDIAIALVISAVGATGSGSLEHLIEVIVDAARRAGIHSASHTVIRCDTYILQPSQDATDLGLANTLALYAELAASQLAQNDTRRRGYQGRKIMIGWGSDFVLPSLEQLEEAAATIIRLSSDASTEFPAEFQEREVDNFALRELASETNLPSHLSLATVITIGLGRLEEQVIQRDLARLVNALAFDTQSADQRSNVLLGRFAEALAGETHEDRYGALVDYLSEPIGWRQMRRQLDAIVTRKGMPHREKGRRLMGSWQEYKEEIKQARRQIEEYGVAFLDVALAELNAVRGERICKAGVSLTTLHAEYSALRELLSNVLEIARADVRRTVDDSPVQRRYKALEGWWPFNRARKVRLLAEAMKSNLREYQRNNARATAIKILEALEQRCEEIVRDLEIVLKKLRRQRSEGELLAASGRNFSIESGHLLNILALSNVDEINAYAARVSIFSARVQGGDQLAEFRQWLQGREELEDLFKGNVDRLLAVVTDYVKEKVREGVQRHSVLDILHQAGEDILQQRMKQAATKATTLVRYTPGLAGQSRPKWHVSAYYRSEEQRAELERALDAAFAQGQCTLLHSDDPTEIAVFYYVDGIPMSAIEDLRGRCLDAFLKRRQRWHRQKALLRLDAPAGSLDYVNQNVGVPIYSGKDAEERVLSTGVIKFLYDLHDPVVEESVDTIPELSWPPVPPEETKHEEVEDHSMLNGNSGKATTAQSETQPSKI